MKKILLLSALIVLTLISCCFADQAAGIGSHKNTKSILLAENAGSTGTNRFLIIPGKSIGHIEIGKPISKKAMNLMGKPTSFTPPTTGKKGIDTGSYYWKDTLNVKINDGKNDLNVYQAFIMSPKYYTARGVRLGSTINDLKKAYPKGKKVELMDHDFGWEIPGMIFGIYENKVASISVHPLEPLE